MCLFFYIFLFCVLDKYDYWFFGIFGKEWEEKISRFKLNVIVDIRGIFKKMGVVGFVVRVLEFLVRLVFVDIEMGFRLNGCYELYYLIIYCLYL